MRENLHGENVPDIFDETVRRTPLTEEDRAVLIEHALSSVQNRHNERLILEAPDVEAAIKAVVRANIAWGFCGFGMYVEGRGNKITMRCGLYEGVVTWKEIVSIVRGKVATTTGTQLALF